MVPSKTVNLSVKQLINDYYDHLISLVELHTDELYNQYSHRDVLMKEPAVKSISTWSNSTQMTESHGVKSYVNPYKNETYKIKKPDLLTSNSVFQAGETRVWAYLTTTRDEMVTLLEEARRDSLAVATDDSDMNSEKYRVLPFVKRISFILQIEEFKESFKYKSCKNINPSIFKLYLVELDFNLGQMDWFILRNSLKTFIVEGKINYGTKTIKIERYGDGKIIDINENGLLVHMLYEYLRVYFRQSKLFEHVIRVRKNDLVNIKNLDLLIVYYNFNIDISDKKFENNQSFEENEMTVKSSKIDNIAVDLKSLTICSSLSSVQVESKLSNLSAFRQLEYLKLEKAQLIASSFTGLSKLKRLELYRCDFKDFPCNSFSDINNLEVLTIKRSMNYEYVDFGQLKNLKWLHVEFFTEMEVLDTFTPKLEVLKIESSIRPINLDKFKTTIQRFYALKVLEFDLNDMNSFCINWLSAQSWLEKLIITRCNIKQINLTLIKSIILNMLTEIKVMGHRFTEFSANDFINMPRLHKMSLVANHIKKITVESFRNVAHLKSLDLSSNQIESIEAKAFANAFKLDILTLSCNQLAKLMSDMFYGLEKLSEIHLRSNPLIEIDPIVFDNMPSIRRIYLDRFRNKKCETYFKNYFKNRSTFLNYP